MANPTKATIFSTLTSCKHTTAEDQNLFSERYYNADYWLYSDLYNLFESPAFDLHDMDNHIYQTLDRTPAKKLSIPPYDFLKRHAVSYEHKYHIKSPHPPYNIIHKKGPDLKLSRYACFCLFRNEPHLIFTRVYFMMPNTDFKTIYDTSYQFARIYQRSKLRESERILSGVLSKLHANIPLFQYETARTFFGDRTTDCIREMHGLGPDTTLADNMGAVSLFARRTAINNAVFKFQFAYTQDLRSFAMILHDELRKSRNQMISDYKFPPEQDIYRTPVSTIESEYKALEKDFIKQHSMINIRTR